MTDVKYVRQIYIDELKNSIDPKMYTSQENPWLDSFYENTNYSATLKRKPTNEIILNEEGKPENDLENIKTVHKSLRFFEPRHLAFEGVWVYFTHIYFWTYMKKRWVNEDMSKASIIQRFFYDGSSTRAMLRNGIARLWFIGHATYDPNTPDDPYHLTSILMSNQDVLMNVAERASLFSIPNFKNAILDEIKDNNILLDRETLRTLMMKFIFLTGIKRLDSFSYDELRGMIQKKINSL